MTDTLLLKPSLNFTTIHYASLDISTQFFVFLSCSTLLQILSNLLPTNRAVIRYYTFWASGIVDK